MEFYHLINRGVDKVQYLRKMATTSVSFTTCMSLMIRKAIPNSAVKPLAQRHESVICWSIYMRFSYATNHYHLLVSPAQDGALSPFMRKSSIWATQSILMRNKSVLSVFRQGTFRKF